MSKSNKIIGVSAVSQLPAFPFPTRRAIKIAKEAQKVKDKALNKHIQKWECLPTYGKSVEWFINDTRFLTHISSFESKAGMSASEELFSNIFVRYSDERLLEFVLRDPKSVNPKAFAGATLTLCNEALAVSKLLELHKFATTSYTSSDDEQKAEAAYSVVRDIIDYAFAKHGTNTHSQNATAQVLAWVLMSKQSRLNIRSANVAEDFVVELLHYDSTLPVEESVIYKHQYASEFALPTNVAFALLDGYLYDSTQFVKLRDDIIMMILANLPASNDSVIAKGKELAKYTRNSNLKLCLEIEQWLEEVENVRSLSAQLHPRISGKHVYSGRVFSELPLLSVFSSRNDVGVGVSDYAIKVGNSTAIRVSPDAISQFSALHYVPKRTKPVLPVDIILTSPKYEKIRLRKDTAVFLVTQQN